MKLLTTQEMLDEIMDSFDFQKVATVMEILKWKVYLGNEVYKVPDESELRRLARRDIKSLIENTETSVEDFHWTQCGPFKITLLKEGGLITSITLDFVVTSTFVENTDELF